jgi:acetoin utilization deacetylase AcuC-like enzyme
MTLLYRSPRFLDHETGSHPERPIRLRAIETWLTQHWLGAQTTQPTFETCPRHNLELVHAAAYIEQVIAFAGEGGGNLDPDTVVCPASADVAQLAAGAVVDAVQRVVKGEDKTALCLVRPPGHHALVDQAMGFCLFNNIAIGARSAIVDHGLNRVMVVDFDIHHGNGTQAAFWEDPQVGFLSMHRWPFWPGTGSADETGSRAGLGSTVNLPVEYGTPRKEVVKRFTVRLQDFADQIRPELIFISAGFDAHRQDPIGDLGLETEEFASMTNAILAVANTHAGGRVVSVLEGGYNPPVLAECVGEHLLRLIDAK